MAKIIKATDPNADAVLRYERGALSPPVAEDTPVEEEAYEETPEPQETPEEVLAQARAEAERVIRDGYAEGLRRGTQAGKEEFMRSVGAAADMLVNAAQALVQAREGFLRSVEPQVIALVKAMTERVLQREPSIDAALLETTVRAALGNLVDRERVTLRVNPHDLEALRAQQANLLDDFPAVGQLLIVADEQVGAGGCIAETESLQVDARLDAQLEKILDALTE